MGAQLTETKPENHLLVIQNDRIKWDGYNIDSPFYIAFNILSTDFILAVDERRKFILPMMMWPGFPAKKPITIDKMRRQFIHISAQLKTGPIFVVIK